MWLDKVMDAARRRTSGVPTPAPTPNTTPTSEAVRYRLTDPGAVPVVKEEALPSQPVNPPITVAGFYGGGQELDSPAGQAAGVYMTIHNAISQYNSFSEKPLEKWAATPNLKVMPRAGKQLNAYYNRNALCFFFGADPALGREIYTADSPDVVAHETGHALLDSFRPDLWNVANLEVWAFHETFGDVISMVSALRHPEVAQLVLDVTHGDLKKDNPVSCLGEQMAQAVYSQSHPAGMNPSWLRNAHNAFKYQSPLGLPDDGPDDQLIAEPHSFSRIMTGALYDCLVTIYHDELKAGKDALTALLNAGRGLGWYVQRAAARTPVKGKFFNSFATAMLAVDSGLSQRYYYDRFKWIFQQRGLIAADPKLLLSEANVGTGKVVQVRLSDCMPLRALALNPLYNVNIQIADDGIDSVLAAQDLVQYLHKHQKVSDSPNTPFQISDGNLERTHFACGCLRNWQNPTQPEYQKPPKPENHAVLSGCGCGQRKTEDQPRRWTVSEANVRYKSGAGVWYRS